MKQLLTSIVSASLFGLFLAGTAHGQVKIRPGYTPHQVTAPTAHVRQQPGGAIHHAATGGTWSPPLTPAPATGGGGGVHTQEKDPTATRDVAMLTFISLTCTKTNETFPMVDETEMRVYFGSNVNADFTQDSRHIAGMSVGTVLDLSHLRSFRVQRNVRVEIWEDDDFPETDDRLGMAVLRVTTGFGVKKQIFTNDDTYSQYVLLYRLDPIQ